MTWSIRARYVGANHELIDGWDLPLDLLGDTRQVFLSQWGQELLTNFAIFGNFHVDFFLEGAVAGRLNVELSAELFFFLWETLPFVVDF